jgi:hypothetical protein
MFRQNIMAAGVYGGDSLPHGEQETKRKKELGTSYNLQRHTWACFFKFLKFPEPLKRVPPAGDQLSLWGTFHIQIIALFFSFWQYWCLNSDLHLEPLHQPFFVLGFFQDRVSRTIFQG